MPDVRRAGPKGHSELTLEWDRLAGERDRQLRSGVDLSFRHIVSPTALRLLEAADLSLLLDIGSGTGHFSALVSDRCRQVLGVEPSGSSIRIARSVCADRHNVQFVQSTIEALTVASVDGTATAAVALMVMMATPDLSTFASSLSSLLPTGAMFVAVIPHPCFWPTYWGYAEATWFDYTEETFIEAPFKISNARTDVLTTHIHRPLEQYAATFSACGFRLDVLEEPMPSEEVNSVYPARWRFPRFLAMRWVKG
jgi:SAM-dependent methyltransferase